MNTSNNTRKPSHRSFPRISLFSLVTLSLILGAATFTLFTLFLVGVTWEASGQMAAKIGIQDRNLAEMERVFGLQEIIAIGGSGSVALGLSGIVLIATLICSLVFYFLQSRLGAIPRASA